MYASKKQARIISKACVLLRNVNYVWNDCKLSNATLEPTTISISGADDGMGDECAISFHLWGSQQAGMPMSQAALFSVPRDATHAGHESFTKLFLFAMWENYLPDLAIL